MRFLLALIAAILSADAVAGPVEEAEKAAPTVECHPASFDGVEWCFTKMRLPDGSLVSSAVFVQNGKAHGAVKLLSSPKSSMVPVR